MEKRLIEKYFLGKCTPKEEEKVKAWLETMKEDFNDLSAIEQDWNEFELDEELADKWNPYPVFQQLQKQIENENKTRHIHLPHPVLNKDNSNRFFGNYPWAGKIARAAILTLLLAAGILFFWKVTDESDEPVLAENIEVPLITKSTKNGERSTLKLSDGTVVKLNANSSITFRKQFDNNIRKVTLTGEAFFDVAHDSLKPFEVFTNDLKTTVLGTSFNVKAYPEQAHTSIALVEGKVKVSNVTEKINNKKEDTVILLPHQELVYSKQDLHMKTKPLDRDNIAWKYGILIFKAATMDEIVTSLEKWYGVKVVYPKNKYSTLRFTGRFDNKSLRQVMDGVSLTAQFKFELEGKMLKIE